MEHHVCKFCNKSFPCGRSLGGHMRSHVINSAERDEKVPKRKLKSVNNANCILRENPKKSHGFADSNEDEVEQEQDLLLHDKLCRKCGKGFQSWKALFGHMKCHSRRFLNTVEEDDSDSWIRDNRKQPITDSQSDNEKKKKRSRTGQTRYMGSTNYCFSNANNASKSSVSEIEQEQAEVAMCLIMLSRDVGKKISGLNSVAESNSDNHFELLEAKSSFTRIKFAKKEDKNSGSSENFQYRVKQSDFGSKESKKSVEFGMNLKKRSGQQGRAEYRSKKRNNLSDKRLDLSGPELGTDIGNKLTSFGDWDTGGLEKKRKFECIGCKKTFQTSQALGGHRASHKKNKSCFASKVESSENTMERGNFIGATANEGKTEHQFANKNNNTKKKKKTHFECPTCFKVFSSGQALGGHKRSHLITASDSKSNQTFVINKQIPGIRDFLDLNLPAPAEEEKEEESSVFKPWWEECNANEQDSLLQILPQGPVRSEDM